MKRSKNTIKKIFILIFVITEAFLISVPQALALHIPTPTEVAEDLEARYHINPESVSDMGEALNVAGNKTTAPQVMITFEPSNPKPGEKITARANPMYFKNPKEELYYTWYLQRAQRNPNGSIKVGSSSGNVLYECENDDMEHCKNTAMRIIANGGFDSATINYDDPKYEGDKDHDGYSATFGGDHQKGSAHCYLHDFNTGINYETVYRYNPLSTVPSITCTTETATCGQNDYQTGTDTGTCIMPTNLIARTPSCSGTLPVCPEDYTPYCLDRTAIATDTCSNLNTGYPSCSYTNQTVEVNCSHLFPEAVNRGAGDGNFKLAEEDFWKTHPLDPDTAKNGNKDEANVVGLGQYTFTWNYQEYDRVGVAVEGVSMIPTKYDDGSYMIMWALPKNKCDIGSTTYVRNADGTLPVIKGYTVKIPATYKDMNKCLKDNVVDPRENTYGKLDVSVTYAPDNPVNDLTADKMGDTVVAQATVSGAENAAQMNYKWNVDISSNAAFDSYNNITNRLVSDKLINGPVRGIGLSELSLNLNLDSSYLEDNGINANASEFYLRFRVEVTGNEETSSFSIEGVSGVVGGEVRQGKSDVIVKITNSTSRIEAYTAEISGGKFALGDQICTRQSGAGNNLQRYVCFVVKNQVVGVTIPDDTFQNFSWKLNDKSLMCDNSVSSACANNVTSGVNFFPVTGNPGDSYTVTALANDGAGKSVELSRTFQIVDPYVKIVSADGNVSSWPKYLGSYQNLNGESFDDLSEHVYQTSIGKRVELKAEFHPDWIGQYYSKNSWALNGQTQNSDTVNLSFDANDEVGSAYNTEFNAIYSNSADDRAQRKAMQDIWGISQFESVNKEILSDSLQVEIIDEGTMATAQVKQFMAALFSNTPSNIVFMIRIILCIFLIIATSSFVFALQPKRLL